MESLRVDILALATTFPFASEAIGRNKNENPHLCFRHPGTVNTAVLSEDPIPFS